MDRIYEKIKKLLALANSSNEHEARSAAAMANKMMVAHNITMQEVKTDRNYEESVIEESSKRSQESKFIMNLMQRYFFVETYCERSRKTKTTKTVFVGTPENVEIASYIYDFLIGAFRSSWEVFKKENNLKASSKQSYYFGLWKGLGEQFEAAKTEVETETGLVVVKDSEIQKWMKSQGTNVTQRSAKVATRDQGSVEAGREAGRNMEIRRGIGESNNSNRTILIG